MLKEFHTENRIPCRIFLWQAGPDDQCGFWNLVQLPGGAWHPEEGDLSLICPFQSPWEGLHSARSTDRKSSMFSLCLSWEVHQVCLRNHLVVRRVIALNIDNYWNSGVRSWPDVPAPRTECLSSVPCAVRWSFLTSQQLSDTVLIAPCCMEKEIEGHRGLVASRLKSAWILISILFNVVVPWLRVPTPLAFSMTVGTQFMSRNCITDSVSTHIKRIGDGAWLRL